MYNILYTLLKERMVATEKDDTRLGRLEGQIESLAEGLRDVRQEVRQGLASVNSRIDRLTLAILGIGGGVVVALVSLIGVLVARE